MHLSLSPVRSDRPLVLERRGETLIINERAYDFEALLEGGVLTETDLDSVWLVGPVRRMDGVLHLEIALPHGAEATQARRFPAPVAVDQDGVVSLPE